MSVPKGGEQSVYFNISRALSTSVSYLVGFHLTQSCEMDGEYHIISALKNLGLESPDGCQRLILPVETMGHTQGLASEPPWLVRCVCVSLLPGGQWRW
jgi:hypothetical protein